MTSVMVNGLPGKMATKVAEHIDALRYLQRKVEAREKGRFYSMIDVLKGE